MTRASRAIYFGGVVLGALVIGVTLWAWGQPPISKSGEVRLWVGSIWSKENSQQIADWYSFSHAVQGMLVAMIGKVFARWISFPVLFAVGLAVGVGWELVEHTDLVLNQFRATTIYQDYIGDSVLNAVSDYVFMLAGFALAWALPVPMILAVIAVFEGVSAYFARDSLLLTTIRVVHPIPAITAWQDEINPRTHPELQDTAATAELN